MSRINYYKKKTVWLTRERCLSLVGFIVFVLGCILLSSASANIPATQIRNLLAKHHHYTQPRFDANNENEIGSTTNLRDSHTNRNVLNDLKNHYRFVFFFRSTCPHCHRFTPVLKDFASFYDVPIRAYSLDGPDLDNLHARKMGAAQYRKYFLSGNFKAVVPALFLQDTTTLQTYAVMFGEAPPWLLAGRMNALLKHIEATQRAADEAPSTSPVRTSMIAPEPTPVFARTRPNRIDQGATYP